MMEKTRMIFVRHGESEGNKVHAFLGHSDANLSEKGHLQAEKTAEYLKNEKIDAFYSSDLRRAYQTGCHIAGRHGCAPIADEKLREVFAGEWEWKKFEDLLIEYPVSFGIWKENVGEAHPDGGEAVSHLYDRIIKRVWEIARENFGKTVLITSHATPIRALRAYWEGLGAKDMKLFPWASNASVSVCDYFSDGHVEMVSYSDDSFMGDIATALPKSV